MADAAWKKFVSALQKEGVEFEDIALCDEESRYRLIDLAKPSAMERALISSNWAKLAATSASGAPAATEVLAKKIEQDALLRIRPWRQKLLEIEADLHQLATLDVATLRSEYLEAAKAAQITPEESLLLQTVLFFNPVEQLQVCGSILRKRGLPRMQSFNVLASTRGAAPDAFIAERGEQLLTLALPIFPREKEFTSLNTQIFLLQEKPLGGTSPTGPHKTLFFRVNTAEARVNSKIEGGGMLPVTQQSDGSWGVDTAPLEQWVLRQRGTQRGRGRGRGRGTRGRGDPGRGGRAQGRGPCWTCGGDHRASDCPHGAGEEEDPNPKNE